MDAPQIFIALSILVLLVMMLSTWKHPGKRDAAETGLLVVALYFLCVKALPLEWRFVAVGVGMAAGLLLLGVLGLIRKFRWMIGTALATMVLLGALEFFYPIQNTTVRNTLLALTAISAIAFVISGIGTTVKEARYHMANR